MAGKKWCEYCRINLPYTKKDIQNHEATRQHLQNKQKSIKFQRIKIRKQRTEKKQSQHEVMLSTANIPKAKKGSELEQQIGAYRDAVIDQGKRAIHLMIAQRTKGLYGAPIQYPDKQQLVLAENYQQDKEEQNQGSQNEENYEMWKIDICDQTGEPCFINRVTKLVLYQPPKGYILSQEQKEEWEYLKQICKDKVQVNPDATVNISQWEEMPEQQNYFLMNKAQQPGDQEQFNKTDNQNEQPFEEHKKYLNKISDAKKTENQQQLNQKPKTWKEELEEKLINNEISTNQVFEKFIENEMKNCKTVKQKNQNLKKLIESGIQVRSRPTDEILLAPETKFQDDGECKIQEKPKITFKPRKKVQISSNSLKLYQQKDIC